LAVVLGLKDVDFISRADSISSPGDQVQLTHWKAEVGKYLKSYREEKLFILGLSSESHSVLSWLTYQFSHAGIIHLLSNCVFIFFLGLAVEKLIGSYLMITIYLGGGIAGGFFYLWMNPQSLTPMVGASASLSALMAFYALFEERKNVRYFYGLWPTEGFYGFIYLSPLLIVPLFLVSDLSQVIGSSAGANANVAYSAHIGGAFVGIISALFLRWVARLKKLKWTEEELNPQVVNGGVDSDDYWDDDL
jgi:membrane associated rhomboid family serine protease